MKKIRLLEGSKPHTFLNPQNLGLNIGKIPEIQAWKMPERILA